MMKQFLQGHNEMDRQIERYMYMDIQIYIDRMINELMNIYEKLDKQIKRKEDRWQDIEIHVKKR